MLVFRNGRVVGADALGVKFYGTYKDTSNNQFDIEMTVEYPPNIPLVQGSIIGSQREIVQLNFQMPFNFSDQPYIRIDSKHGPLNAKFVRLSDLDD